MKKNLLILIILTVIIIKLCYCIEDTIYYDGEGNVLPPKAITALVRSQYVITTPEEDSLIRKYFK